MPRDPKCHYCQSKATKKVYNKVITYPKYLCNSCFKKTDLGENMIVEDISGE